MDIFDTIIDVYEITPPIAGKFYWGAKATIYTKDGKFSLKEVWGRTKGEAEHKAKLSAEEYTFKNDSR